MPLPPAREPAARKTLADEVYDYLFAAIVEGEILSGEELNDKEIGARLGVSRTPVREALRRLAGYRLVEMIPSKSTRVALIDERRVVEAADTLHCLSAQAIREGVPALDDEARGRLSGILAQAEAAAEAENERILSRQAHAYFDGLAEAAGNSSLQMVMSVVVAQTWLAMPNARNLSREELVAGLSRLHERVLAGDVEGAETALDDMSVSVQKAFLFLAHGQK